MLFKWKDEYELDIPEIDVQHKKLFEIGGRIEDLATSQGDFDYYDEFILVLEELVDYTEYHFKTEEELLKSKHYDKFDEHQKQHVLFIFKVKKLLKEDLDEMQQEKILDLLSFISEWISRHVMITDRKYVTTVKEI